MQRVQLAIDTLSLEHRAAFILFELEGESCESIASGLQIPLGTVYSRLHAARRGFQKAYAELTRDSGRKSASPGGASVVIERGGAL